MIHAGEVCHKQTLPDKELLIKNHLRALIVFTH